MKLEMAQKLEYVQLLLEEGRLTPQEALEILDNPGFEIFCEKPSHSAVFELQPGPCICFGSRARSCRAHKD